MLTGCRTGIFYSFNTHSRAPYECGARGECPKKNERRPCSLQSKAFQGPEFQSYLPFCFRSPGFNTACGFSSKHPENHSLTHSTPLPLSSGCSPQHPLFAPPRSPPPAREPNPGRSRARLGRCCSGELSAPAPWPKPQEFTTKSQSETPCSEERPGLCLTPPHLGALFCSIGGAREWDAAGGR